MNAQLSDNEKNLILQLREEAKSVKECYTKFSFQAFAITIAVFGLVCKFQKDDPLIAFAFIPSILIILVVNRIGTFKYETANRNFGYDLHLYRTLHLKDSPPEGWQAYMREIGWEEAMKAWRVVQVTIFKYLYKKDIFGSNILKEEHKERGYLWFEPNTLIISGTNYHAGSYLKMMNGFLLFIANISIIPMFIATYQLYLSDSDMWILAIVISLIILSLTIKEVINFKHRRKILESGLLSIHSCAIVWQVVVVSHYRTIDRISRNPTNIGFRDYTKYLSEEAKNLTENIFDIHIWVLGKSPIGGNTNK